MQCNTVYCIHHQIWYLMYMWNWKTFVLIVGYIFQSCCPVWCACSGVSAQMQRHAFGRKGTFYSILLCFIFHSIVFYAMICGLVTGRCAIMLLLAATYLPRCDFVCIVCWSQVFAMYDCIRLLNTLNIFHNILNQILKQTFGMYGRILWLLSTQMELWTGVQTRHTLSDYKR